MLSRKNDIFARWRILRGEYIGMLCVIFRNQLWGGSSEEKMKTMWMHDNSTSEKTKGQTPILKLNCGKLTTLKLAKSIQQKKGVGNLRPFRAI